MGRKPRPLGRFLMIDILFDNLQVYHADQVMKARYNYRIHPKQSQLTPLAKTFGSSRVVWNDAWWLYKNAERNNLDRPTKISNLVITQAKKTESRSWLSDVSAVVLQQSLRDLEAAWSNYFSSLKGARQGKKLGKPKPKKKHSRQAIRFASNALAAQKEAAENQKG